MPELLIGCGHNKAKKLWIEDQNEWKGLTTLDIDPTTKPGVVWDLVNIPLPFEDDFFDEIPAYEVLEHIGSQGDWRFFFAQFSAFWRILRPGGYIMGTSPKASSPWAWGDPGHSRIISME